MEAIVKLFLFAVLSKFVYRGAHPQLLHRVGIYFRSLLRIISFPFNDTPNCSKQEKFYLAIPQQHHQVVKIL